MGGGGTLDSPGVFRGPPTGKAFVAAVFLAMTGWFCAPDLRAGVLPYGMKIEPVLPAGPAAIGDLEQSPSGELWLLERETGTIRVFVSGAETATMTIPVLAICDGGLLDVAFAPDYTWSGRAFVSYVDPTGSLRVDEIFRQPSSLSLGATILAPGSTPGCRPGGGLAIGSDGRLYLGVGDLEDPLAAPRLSRLPGKILRVNLDGSIPSDNPFAGSPIFARGFRNPTDLDVHLRAGSDTLYAADLGAPGEAADEIDVVQPAGHYGWSNISGDSGGLFDDPILWFQPTVGLEGLVVVSGSGLDGVSEDSLIFTRVDVDELSQAFLAGPALDTLTGTRTFYDPDGDRDGTADAGCPRRFQALTEGGDGMLYAAGNGANAGVWRMYEDRPGPREVSPPGSPFPLSVKKEGSLLRLEWEELGPLDAGRPPRNGGQDATAYRIWEGTLPIAGAYDHVLSQATDGTPAGQFRLGASVLPGAGSRYYLVSAQGDNLEGSAGKASSGAPRGPAEVDHCVAIGNGRFTGDCIDDFRNPVTGQPMKLTDFNPGSPTYMQQLSVRDFRGKVVHLDLSSDDCPWCNLQAPTFHAVDLAYRDRDFIEITVFNQFFSGPFTYSSTAACAAAVLAWVDRHGVLSPVLCDVDLNGDTLGDVARQYWHLANEPEPCGGSPQNFFIDQGGVIFDFTCSFTPGPEVETRILPEINPESCE